jgi:hypothetical protein
MATSPFNDAGGNRIALGEVVVIAQIGVVLEQIVSAFVGVLSGFGGKPIPV